ncbi:MAG TPA: ATP-binding protein [Phycisphaerae bacterium]
MARGRFSWKLFLGTALLTTLVWSALVWLIVRQVEALYRDDITRQLVAYTELLRQEFGDRLDLVHAAELDAQTKQIGAIRAAGIRVTLIAPDGTVLADSDADPSQLESHRDRPEVIQALASGTGQSTRWSHSVNREMKYVALRVGSADRPSGIVRVSMAIPTIGARTEASRRFIWTVTAVAVLAIIAWAVGLAYLWSGPLARITAAARSLSEGDLSARADVSGSSELAALARALNQMRAHLAAQIQTIDRQRRTLQSLLEQLNEGVVVGGADGRVVMMNPAAIRLLDLPCEPTDGCTGRAVEECIPQHGLQRMLLIKPESGGAAADASLHESRLDVDGRSGRMSLLARAADIVLPAPESTGAAPAAGRLLVVTDITELNRTLQMRTDFVANASHELRTPLSAILAAIETMQKMNLAREAEAAGQFLDMIDRQATRLEALVADLLDLSRVESPAVPFESATLYLPQTVQELHERFAEVLQAKQLAWRADLPPECTRLNASPHLLRLILDNLVDNAIKFTDPGGSIRVSCRCTPQEITIEVADSGCGIPGDEQERVFERFYQVERARSGTGSPKSSQRGTGLGLSIVRHAVAAMNGTVGLTSQPGQGTRVAVTIPRGPSVLEAGKV